jgi:hypothetical protein
MPMLTLGSPIPMLTSAVARDEEPRSRQVKSIAARVCGIATRMDMEFSERVTDTSPSLAHRDFDSLYHFGIARRD